MDSFLLLPPFLRIILGLKAHLPLGVILQPVSCNRLMELPTVSSYVLKSDQLSCLIQLPELSDVSEWNETTADMLA